MLRTTSRMFSALLGFFVISSVVVACDEDDGPTGPTPEEEIEMVRSAVEPYEDLATARDAGYVQFSVHVPGMGVHYLHDSAINSDATSALDGSLDREEPEVLVYVNGESGSSEADLVAVEYAIPQEGESPPAEAVDLFAEADAEDWHVHPSVHELPLPDTWTIHGECHYQGGIGVFLAENPDGEFVFWTPPTGALGSWNGTVEPAQCPETLGEQQLPPLLLAHGKWWTLHAWVSLDNPEGMFHPTNPQVSG